MSPAQPHKPAPPSATALLRLDQACDRFEAALRAGQQPRIEDYVDQVAPAERPALLKQLVTLEACYRRLRGELPTPEEYRARFSGLDPTWTAAAIASSRLGCAAPLPGAADPTTGWAGTTTPGKTLPSIPGYEVLAE